MKVFISGMVMTTSFAVRLLSTNVRATPFTDVIAAHAWWWLNQ